MIGKTFGNLTVLSLELNRTKDGRKRYLCECVCGNTKIITGKYLRNGDTTGCGCPTTKRIRARVGEHNPNWKGGKNNRGSLAWANGKIAKISKNSENLGYSKVNGNSEELIALLKKSDGKCAICGKIEDDSQYGRNHVDHCHNTGKLRGMLCPNCNIGLGAFNDSFELLSKAIKYLEYNS
jgi:hypothetical protein